MNEHNIKVYESHFKKSRLKQLFSIVNIDCTRLDYKNGMAPSLKGRILLYYCCAIELKIPLIM